MINTTITRNYAFEAAHFLPLVPDTHKCKRMHGHNYELEITVSGPINPVGFIVDFWDLDDVVKPLIEKLDHRTLNDIEGLGNPTAEYIAHWFLLRLIDHGVTAVRVYETSRCWADAKVPG